MGGEIAVVRTGDGLPDGEIPVVDGVAVPRGVDLSKVGGYLNAGQKRCEHVSEDGDRCNAWTKTGSEFCHTHSQQLGALSAKMKSLALKGVGPDIAKHLRFLMDQERGEVMSTMHQTLLLAQARLNECLCRAPEEFSAVEYKALSQEMDRIGRMVVDLGYMVPRVKVQRLFERVMAVVGDQTDEQTYDAIEAELRRLGIAAEAEGGC